MLAISPQNPDNAIKAKKQNGLAFEMLSDANQEVIQKYNLQFDPGDDYHQRRDLTLLNGDGSKLLPIPATFIITQNYVIAAAHIDPNYTLRMQPESILTTLKEIS